MASGDRPKQAKYMTYSKCKLPFLGGLIDYMDTSFEFFWRRAFVKSEKLIAKNSRSKLSATFLAALCLVVGFVANVKVEVVTFDEKPLKNDLHFMLMSKVEDLYIDDIDVSRILWCIEASDCVVLLISCLLVWNSSNATMVKARKYVLKNSFVGAPKRSDYEVVEYQLPALQNGEILVKAEWLSVDPYLRAYNSSLITPYDQFGFQVGEVLETKDPRYPVGSKVVTHKGWCDYSVVSTDNEGKHAMDSVYKLPNLKGLSESLAVGAVGMPGATAYFGFLEGCKPQPGETVVVTGAAGAVGSLVGQIAKLKGCRVIGFAGSDDKVEWLEKDLGFDKAFNYKTVDVPKVLKGVAPNGVDCYFDNVGGEISSQIIYQMNSGGRVTCCGSISSYNEDATQLPKVTLLQPAIVFKELKVDGFLIWSWWNRWPEAFSQLVDWINSGQLKAREHVTVGFDNVFDAFVAMLEGKNFGKAVVKV